MMQPDNICSTIVTHAPCRLFLITLLLLTPPKPKTKKKNRNVPHSVMPPTPPYPNGFRYPNHCQNLSGDSQSTCPIGGYSFPSLVTFGSQVHHSFLGMLSSTAGTWLPPKRKM